MNHAFTLPPNLLIGTASAAAQIEGACSEDAPVEHTWTAWADRGFIKDGSSPRRATDHYRLWREDAALMRALGFPAARIGLEWARIEPRRGVFDPAALAHYREEARLLTAYGIAPLVTLHHFANPLWFEALGGFERAENIPLFLDYIAETVRALGDSVSEFITINEPNVYAFFGYYAGLWPPGKRSFAATLRVMSNLAAAHIRAYRLIRALRETLRLPPARTGCALHLRVFAPRSPRNPLHRAFTAFNRLAFQGALAEALHRGRFLPPLFRPAGTPPPDGGLTADFIGVNYYTRTAVSGVRDGVFPGVPVNGLGWEIYPEGIAIVSRALCRKYPLPLYITENGTCDASDSFRARFIYEHLKALCESGLPAERYYHWCFCDNFEWLEGESARFGIVHVDFETRERTVKRSGRFLAEIARKNGVDEALYEEYVAGTDYPRGVPEASR